MKRGGPIQRRSPLKATASLQRGTASLSRAKRVNPRSAKRTAVMVERRALVRLMLTAEPRCQAQVLCRGARSVDVHERLKRSRGGSIVDPIQAHAITVCRRCHEWTEAEPAKATTARLLLPSWHVCPPVGPC